MVGIALRAAALSRHSTRRCCARAMGSLYSTSTLVRGKVEVLLHQVQREAPQATCILAIPLASWQGHHAAAAWLIAIVRVEVAILVVNGWRCPLTSLAARYTKERHDNFDRRRSVEIVMAARTGPGHHRSHATVGALLP